LIDGEESGLIETPSHGRRLANDDVSSPKYGTEGGPMCDEYYDERMKALWRAIADESELERDEEREEESPRPIAIEPLDLPKAKPKALLR